MQRHLESGALVGVKLGGGWRIPAIAIWRKLGIEAEMIAVWRDDCHEEARRRREEAEADAQRHREVEVDAARAELLGDAEPGVGAPTGAPQADLDKTKA